MPLRARAGSDRPLPELRRSSSFPTISRTNGGRNSGLRSVQGRQSLSPPFRPGRPLQRLPAQHFSRTRSPARDNRCQGDLRRDGSRRPRPGTGRIPAAVPVILSIPVSAGGSPSYRAAAEAWHKAANPSASRQAPPTSAPSMSGWATISPTLSAFTEPP